MSHAATLQVSTHLTPVTKGRAHARVGKVPGVPLGPFCVRQVGQRIQGLDASGLARALPGPRESREGGLRDGLESMALALFSRGIPLEAINNATTEVLDAYGNDI